MLLFENHLSHEINSLLMNENRLRIAVAFIGDGASQRINPNAKDVQIICNLTMNGTNPAEVQNLIHRFGSGSIKQIDNLHAKLYIGSEYAIVGSANLSANGLGTQPTALREAGYKFKLDQPSGRRSLDWFNDALWGDAREITPKDLKDAAERWKRRDFDRNGSWKSSLRSICDYDFDSEDFPLLVWIGNSDFDVIDDDLMGKSSLAGWGSLEDAVGSGVEIECDDDIDYLNRDRWILKFYPRINTRPFWQQLSGFVLMNSFKYPGSGELQSVVVVKKVPENYPFIIDSLFVEKFRDLLFKCKKYSE